MNITELFQRHFTQCRAEEAEFFINGIGHKGAWPKDQSMPLFIKDLMDEADHERDAEYESIADAKERIKELEDEISTLESDASSLEADNEKLEEENADLQAQIEKLEAELSNKD